MSPGFFRGLTFWLRGWGMMLDSRSLLLLALVPFVIALLVAGFSISYVFTHLPAWVQAIMAYGLSSAPAFLHYLYYPMLIGSGLLVVIAGVFVAYLGQSILAVPFYSLLADRTLAPLNMKTEVPFEWRRWLRNSLRMLRISLMKTALFLTLGVILFAVSFVPVVNVVAVFGTLLILAFDLLDFSFESLHYSFRQRLAYVARHKRMWAGMACGLGLTLLIPGLTLVIAPGAVVGAALLLKESANGS